jgi:hypothetical protein
VIDLLCARRTSGYERLCQYPRGTAYTIERQVDPNPMLDSSNTFVAAYRFFSSAAGTS